MKQPYQPHMMVYPSRLLTSMKHNHNLIHQHTLTIAAAFGEALKQFVRHGGGADIQSVAAKVAAVALVAGFGSSIIRRFAVALLPLIHISEPTILLSTSYAVSCLKKKKSSTHLLDQETVIDNICRPLLSNNK